MWIQAHTHISERICKNCSYYFNDNLVYLKKKKEKQ